MDRSLVFGVVAGVVVSIAGSNVIDDPIKTIALISVLVIAHKWSKS